MFRVMTFDAAAQNKTSPDYLRTRLHPLRQEGIDLLCCQSVNRSLDGEEHFCRWLSETLSLTCSSFAAGRPQSGPLPIGKQTAKGLAMLTGTGMWVLNSGSFVIGDTGEEAIVQFAIVRKNGASVLALNLHLAASQQAQTRQLRDLFLQPLLKDRYGAVVLCADRPVALPLKQWQDLTARSNYSLHLPPTADSGPLLCLFTARTEAVSMVTMHRAEPMQRPHANVSTILPGKIVAFEIQRVVSDKLIRPFFPLSYREQWLGYKDNRAFA